MWRFDCATGDESLVRGTEAIGWANGLAFDDTGDLFVSDTFSGTEGGEALGAVWRIGTDGVVEKWIESAELGGTGQAGAPSAIGVNGLALGDDKIYLANTERGKILSIDIREDGTAGEISTVAEIGFPDGIAIDDAGRLYVAAIGESSIVRVDPDGATAVIASGAADGLDMPASLAIATGPPTRSRCTSLTSRAFRKWVPGSAPAWWRSTSRTAEPVQIEI